LRKGIKNSSWERYISEPSSFHLQRGVELCSLYFVVCHVRDIEFSSVCICRLPNLFFFLVKCSLSVTIF
jgi:hypothetical protein